MEETTLARNLNMTVNEVRGVSGEVLGAAVDDERRREQVYVTIEGAEDHDVSLNWGGAMPLLAVGEDAQLDDR